MSSELHVWSSNAISYLEPITIITHPVRWPDCCVKAPGIVRVVLFNKTFPRPWIKFVLMMNLPSRRPEEARGLQGAQPERRGTESHRGRRGVMAHRTCASLCPLSTMPNCQTNVPESRLNLTSSQKNLFGITNNQLSIMSKLKSPDFSPFWLLV